MKRPSFQFYPADWLRDTALRTCTVGARGLWIDMICYMHEGNPYGTLKVGNKVILPPNLAVMVGATLQEVEGWLQELETAGVFDRGENGEICSRRMIRDEKIRESRASGGKLGGNPALLGKKKVGGRLTSKDNQNPTPSSSSSSSNSSPPKPPSEEGLRFARWFRSTLSEKIKPSPNWEEQWAKTYDELIRLDHRTKQEITMVCQWARQDPFWATCFLSPLKLRQRDKNKVLYFDIFAQKANQPTLPINGNHPRRELTSADVGL
jgi:hypothetical protein